MRISDWSSDVCSSDLVPVRNTILYGCRFLTRSLAAQSALTLRICPDAVSPRDAITGIERTLSAAWMPSVCTFATLPTRPRSEEHTSELQSLMRISYAVFCLKKKKSTHAKT